ncbi:hypothetical protein U1Q18_000705 [Sarracenia purpurea var. burkii]
MSSRSNSSNSRSSSCSTSARTSTSEASERRRPPNQAKSDGKPPVKREKNQVVFDQQYGSSKRWRFIAPPPVLYHRYQVSCRKKTEIPAKEKSRGKKNAGDQIGKRSGFGRRFFRSFVSACKECHAIKPSKRNDAQPGNMDLQ